MTNVRDLSPRPAPPSAQAAEPARAGDESTAREARAGGESTLGGRALVERTLALHGEDAATVAHALAGLSRTEREAALAALHERAGNHFVGQVMQQLAGPVQPAGQQTGQAAKQGKGPFASKADAVAFHQQQQAMVARVIKQGLGSKDTLVKNTCEWIQQGLCKTIVLTPTHDSDDRATAMGRPGAEAMFDLTRAHPDKGGDYADLANAAGDPLVGSYDKQFEGWMMGDTLLILVRPHTTADQVQGHLVHEVQHQADQREQGGPGRVLIDRVGGAEDTANSFMSEFRAYWIGDGGEGHDGDVFGSSKAAAVNSELAWKDDQGQEHKRTTNLGNQRQSRIVAHLANYEWFRREYTTDEEFAKLVDGYQRPVGVNLVNSVRIQALTDALAMCDPEMKSKAKELAVVRERCADLDAADRKHLADTTASKPFWDYAKEHLPHAECVRLARSIRRESTDDAAGTGGGREQEQAADDQTDGEQKQRD